MANFSKRHYELIAINIAATRRAYAKDKQAKRINEALDVLTAAFVSTFAADNPLFKGELFIKATKEGI